MPVSEVLEAARQAFCETINLKMQQLYRVVPKGANSDLTGKFVEELVRGFIGDWIAPCSLVHGTLYPHDLCEQLSSEDQVPKQIDGIVYDPRLGPAIIREGGFIVVHPLFCPKIIEIKTSEKNIKAFAHRLALIHAQYIWRYNRNRHIVMGIVVHDPDPEAHSFPDWFERPSRAIFDYRISGANPIFVLFKEHQGEYIPYEPAIDALIGSIFGGALEIDRMPRRQAE